MSTRLDQNFFERNVVEVAKELLGKVLIFGQYRCLIIETEAYRSNDDEASHAYKGPTNRSKIMFGKAGVSYVYLIYGMYHCLNVVTEPLGQASAVLLRGVKVLAPTQIVLDGPGKLCRGLGINKAHHAIDMLIDDNLYIIDNNLKVDFIATPRIGITKGIDKLWRFVISEVGQGLCI